VNLQTEEWGNEEVMDLRQLFVRLWARRWLILVIVVVFTAVFAAATFLIKPIYRATTVLLPASSERSSLSNSLSSALGSLGGLASLAGVSVGSSDVVTEEALAVLRSRQFTESFLTDQNLMPKLYARKWDAANGKWRVGPDDQPTPAQAFKYFDKKIRSITQDRKTGLVSLQIDWRDRSEAAAWANELTQRLNTEMRTRAIDKADASLGFLEKELMSTTVLGTREAINRLIETQIKQRMLANVSPEYVFRVVDKAMAPDADDPVWPQKLLLTVAGGFFGLAFGAVLALVLSASSAVPGVPRNN
jgi:uncharacterized protein involved in exopolysaccharide biosynthesis